MKKTVQKFLGDALRQALKSGHEHTLAR